MIASLSPSTICQWIVAVRKRKLKAILCLNMNRYQLSYLKKPEKFFIMFL